MLPLAVCQTRRCRETAWLAGNWAMRGSCADIRNGPKQAACKARPYEVMDLPASLAAAGCGKQG